MVVKMTVLVSLLASVMDLCLKEPLLTTALQSPAVLLDVLETVLVPPCTQIS